MNDGASAALLVVLLIAIAILYFLPSFIANGRERNGGVIVLNVFLGWTLIGWVVALAWAASLPHKEKPKSSGGVFGSFDDKTVLCPFCAEDIKPEAVVCKHCGRDLPSKENEVAQ